MTQAFHASEARITSFLDSIRHGKPIDNGRPWSILDLLTLAGCAHCALLSHPPGWIDRAALEGLDAEKREAIGETNEREILATTQFLSRAAFAALDGHFGQEFGVRDEVKGVLALDAEGRPCVQLQRDTER